MTDPWQDPALPADVRAADLLARMTPQEKAAQLYSVWPGSNETPGGDMAPLQHALSEELDLGELLPHGLGQLTRPFGTAPVEPAEGAARLASLQERIRAANRFRLPALAHEECLTGFTAWQATIFPTPLAWGASFDPALVKEMAAAIGTVMRSVGIHQGLAPVLDVVRDPRWGRTEESIGEDPHLVATVGTAYVQGLQAAGVVATLKHFAGYSASRGARNHAPASLGPRELADVILPPFEMAVHEGGARSVMAAYNDIDGLPAHAHHRLLTGLLREEWQFTGTVVADYFGVSFLESAHGLTDSPAGAAALALAAGVDVELPAVRCFGTGPLDEDLVDRAALRVLTQKCELGLLDPDWAPPAVPSPATDGALDFDPPPARALARRLAEESVVLLSNGPAPGTATGTAPGTATGTATGPLLPIGPEVRRIAVLGPLADDPAAMLGCYTFPRHVLLDHPELPMGVAVPTLLDALRAELPDARFVDDPGAAQVCVVAVGDRSGLFGRGTSGEGCDAADLELPEGQGALLDRVLDAAATGGTPVVLVVFSGRPYALGRWADRCAAIVQAFFPGEEGGPAVAGVLSGRVNPSGRLPVSVPRDPAGQPWTYLAPPLGRRGEASSLDPTPLFPFGHGLSYTAYDWQTPSADADRVPTDGATTLRLTVRNTGGRPGTEVVQLYLHDPVGKVARPVARLVGYARVPLEAGASAEVQFTFPADLAAYTGPDGERIVEPGELELRFGSSSAEEDVRHAVPVTLTGPERVVGPGRRMRCEVRVK
ncbi:beta-glucosidase [Streptomyces cavernae]|uniref:beta-xylosidase/alpha-l-arabinosidase n=1 Tax=Streptomyces cavernae TaxID=2259034 RepID=UPI000FEBED76|nr:glycoside hydrolase family 3 N-terminal domain-containing protein [Streptomyces cavernae]